MAQSNAMRPVISVIITEYWPRDFLKYAVRSVLNQTLDKGLYELIVVKRFRNPAIDRLIESHGGKVIILSDAPIGHYLAVGVNESDGEVAAFLNDAFINRKLEYVYKHVCGKDDVGYYHHLAYVIDGQNKLLGKSFGGPSRTIVINPRARGEVKRVLRKHGLIGSLMSATVIRRELTTEYLRLLETIVTGPDTFMFLASLNSNYLVVHEPLNLSFYRVHGQ
jgi:glycosyltransferase involved in cell wall biosynthesis